MSEQICKYKNEVLEFWPGLYIKFDRSNTRSRTASPAEEVNPPEKQTRGKGRRLHFLNFNSNFAAS